LKYKNKYLNLCTHLQKGGSYQPTFFIYSIWDRHKDFINNMKSHLIERGWKESIVFPVDFIFLYFSYKIEPPILDTNQSKLVNLIKGQTFENIIDQEKFIKKFKHEYFIYPYKFIDSNNIINIDKEYALYPVANKYVDRSYSKKIVSSKEDIEKYMKLYPKFQKWMLRDILKEPVLKNGHIFTLNFIFIIKLNPFKIYAIKKKKYIKSKLIYDSIGFHTNPEIFETFKEEFDKNEVPLFFPTDLPDGWNEKETNDYDKMMENSIRILFSNKIDIEPDNNSKNGYFIFNAFIKLHERLPPFFYYILNVFSPHLHKHIIPALVSILIDNKNHPDFKEIKLDKKIKYSSVDNFEFERCYSFRRMIPQAETSKTFYVNVKLDAPKFHSVMINELIKRGYKESNNFPVDFIFVGKQSSYYRNRFNTKGSKWISLLYGNSKIEISNKIVLNKKFEKEDFIISSLYLTQNSPIPNIDESIIRILKPLNGFEGSGITIIKTKKEIELWLKEHEKNDKYKEWILQNYIQNPDLKDGLKFHLRVLILVKVYNKQVSVYISNYKLYVTAYAKYKNEDWLNKDIHDTHFKSTKREMIFPEDIPDNWTIIDTTKAISDMNQIFIKVFNNQRDFRSDWNAKNGFEIFGADIMFSNKKPYLLEINAKISIGGHNYLIIPGLLETILDDKESEFMTKLI